MPLLPLVSSLLPLASLSLSQYELSDRGIILHIPLCLCCTKLSIDLAAGPMVDVAQWDDCSRLWYGQENPPLEVSEG